MGWHGGGLSIASIAQLEEHLSSKQVVAGSSPVGGICVFYSVLISFAEVQNVCRNFHNGRVRRRVI